MKKNATNAGMADLSRAVAVVHTRRGPQVDPLDPSSVDPVLLIAPGDADDRASFFDFDTGREVLANDAGLLQNLNVDFVDRQLLQFRQTNFGKQVLTQRCETALGQATLQGHLTAFEANFVETASTGFLTLVATACGFTQA